ncbi:MAG: peptidase MA family metallohydrolase [Elusimicrobiales bacterium]
MAIPGKTSWALSLLLCGGVLCSASAAQTQWHKKVSPHFEVMHEAAFSPSSIGLEMEKMYSSMRLNLAMFAPWMVREKTRVYIYATQKSYLEGEFKPPRWSKGLAYVSRKTIVVFDTGDLQKLRAVIAHELTHLYFEGYFAEKLTYPPQWLNEGLAVYMEESGFPEGGPWSRALAWFPRERQVGFDRFFGLKIDQLQSDAQIADWYLQAYGAVLYLYRPHTRLQFKSFCEGLRGGMALEDALWRSYRVGSGRDFGVKWAGWLQEYSKVDRNGMPAGSPSASFNFKPFQVSSYTFTNFGEKK